eukprot:s381_g17.t1
MSELDLLPQFEGHHEWLEAVGPVQEEQTQPATVSDGDESAKGAHGGQEMEPEDEGMKGISFADAGVTPSEAVLTPVKSPVLARLASSPQLEADVQEVPSPHATPMSPKGKGRGRGKGAKGRGKARGKDKESPAEDQSGGAGAEGSVKSVRSSKSKSQSLGQKKQSKTHVKFCKGCNLWYQLSDMANKQSLCHRDKYALDNITRAAVVEGKKEWVKELRSDPARLQEVLARYRTLVGSDIGSRTKMPPSAMFQALQEVAAKSRVLFDSELEFMSEDAYMMYSGTDAGGRLSKTAARAQWKQWEDQIAAGEAPEDLMYDTKKGFLRIACSTRDTVHLQNDTRHELEKSKKLQLRREKEVKSQNLTTDELMRKKKELTLGHDEILICADAEEPGNNTLAMAVMRSAGASGEGFHGKVQDINMADLMVETPAPANADEPMEQDLQEGADDAPGDEVEKQRKVGRGWDKATQIAAKVRGEQSSLLELECLLKTRLEDVEKVKEELSKKSSECNAGVSVELAILGQRRALVSMVLDKSDDGIQRLQEEIAKIQEKAGVADDDGNNITNAPPCSSFEKLQTMRALHDNTNRFYEAANASQLHLGYLLRISLSSPSTRFQAQF